MHTRDVLTPSGNVIRLNYIYIPSGYETHLNARCKGCVLVFVMERREIIETISIHIARFDHHCFHFVARLSH